MGALETYLTDVRDTRLSGEGVSELSYYPALRALLEDVGGYLEAYRQVLVTSLREFLLVALDEHGHPVVLER